MQDSPGLDASRSAALASSGPGKLKRVLYVLDFNPVGKFPSLAEQALDLEARPSIRP